MGKNVIGRTLTTANTLFFFIISRRYNKKHRPQLARLFGAELTR